MTDMANVFNIVGIHRIIRIFKEKIISLQQKGTNELRTMGKLLEQLKNYFENTPVEVLKKESAEWDYLNEIGPDVLEYANMVKGHIGTEMTYSSHDDCFNENNYDFTVSTNDISSNAQYGKAA